MNRDGETCTSTERVDGHFDAQKYPKERHFGPWTPPTVPSHALSFLAHFQIDIFNRLSISLEKWTLRGCVKKNAVFAQPPTTLRTLEHSWFHFAAVTLHCNYSTFLLSVYLVIDITTGVVTFAFIDFCP